MLGSPDLRDSYLKLKKEKTEKQKAETEAAYKSKNSKIMRK